MSKDLFHSCHWCRQPFAGNRKFCSSECRRSAQESMNRDPTLEEICEMCRRIREEGGEAWERSHSCYTPQPVQVRVVAASRLCFSALDE